MLSIWTKTVSLGQLQFPGTITPDVLIPLLTELQGGFDLVGQVADLELPSEL